VALQITQKVVDGVTVLGLDALEAAGHGLTQTLAAAPQLVARWEDARTASPYGCDALELGLGTIAPAPVRRRSCSPPPRLTGPGRRGS